MDLPAPVAPAAGRRRNAAGERTRARLLESARSAFSGVSWSRARVEDVCRVAGVGHGTFYGHYANKTAILEDLVRRHAADLYLLAESRWTGPDVRAGVREVLAGFVAVSERDADIRAIWFAAAPSEPTLAALVEEVRRQFRSRVRRNLAAAAEADWLRPGLDLEVAAHALTSMVEQAVALAAGPGDEVLGLGDRLVDGLTDLWVHAVYRAARL